MQILKLMLIAAAALTSSAAMAQEPLIAFPGAEGFGRFATGGRGGEVYHVTTTADSGTGSLRDAVSQGGRIVVFDVSGDIVLKSPLVFKGNLTVLGQTAPGEGVNVYGDRVSFSGASNLIVRYMRFRMGVNGTSGADACGVANGENMIFDHLSVYWGKDENFSVSWDNKNIRPRNITIQNSIIAQGLQTHSCGGLIQTIGGVTLYRNLYIENKTRNPKVKGLNQFVNNVVYNWGNGGAYIQSDSQSDSWADIENNYFMRGPWNGATAPFTRGISTFRLYGAGNYYDSNRDGLLNGTLMTEEEQIGTQGGTPPYSTLLGSLADLNAVIDDHNTEYSLTESHADYIKNITPISEIMTAEDAYAWVIEHVGASLPVRDVVDQYIVDEAASYGQVGTTDGISSEMSLPHRGVTNLSGGPKPLDSDADGIPDEWEAANGLDPNDPVDAAAIADNGYANIENYAFSITGPYPYIKKPLSLRVTNAGKGSIELAWDTNGNTSVPYEIELAEGSGQFVIAAQTQAGASTATVEGLQAATAYKVRLRAVDAQGLSSDYSPTVETETTDDPAPPGQSYDPYPALGAQEGVAAGITFKWLTPKSYGGTVVYTLLLGTSADELTPICSNIPSNEYFCDTLEAGTTYYWRVDAHNDIGSTEGALWHFTTVDGGVLFYTDFHTQPQEWADTYGYITDNTNIINAANASITCGGLTIGTRDNKIRILNMPGLYSADSAKDYGPATDNDRGATPYAIQYYTTAAGGYMTMPQVEGPCVLTIYLGNTDSSSKTVYLTTRTPEGEETHALALGAKKRIYKHTVSCGSTGPVTFELDANAKKFDVNDVLIERLVVPDVPDAVIDVEADPADAPAYNLLGLPVDASYRGIVISAGKKRLQR